MPLSRIEFSSTTSESLFQRSRRFGSFRRYCSSSTGSTSNAKSPLPLNKETVSPKSRISYVIPASILAGLGGYIHINDERRAAPKGRGEKFERSAIQGPIIDGPFSLANSENQIVTEKSS